MCYIKYTQLIRYRIYLSTRSWQGYSVKPSARHNLGERELNNGNFERARKHFIIAANHGLHESLRCIRTLYSNGNASKEDYFDALRAYQAAVDETKSAEREKAEEAIKNGDW